MAADISRASFRDPSGFVFEREGRIYRQVNRRYQPHFAALMESGLYQNLVDDGLLVSHQEVDTPAPRPERALCVIEPDRIPFVSYPYEWCFGQLRAAALLTLDIQLRALEFGMVLKDASAFNVLFRRGRPVFIDTLSFERYEAGVPWIAYRQFCEHFLAPLLIIRGVDPWLGRLPQLTVDGVPLEVASKLLPLRSRMSPSVQLHIHQHAKLSKRYGGRGLPDSIAKRGMSRSALVSLTEGLRHFIDGLRWEPKGTEWADYETEHGYSASDHRQKKRLVSELLAEFSPGRVWDLGANTGEFSRLARDAGAWVLAADVDPAAVERNYQRTLAMNEESIHPLVLDIRNPSPGLGWGLAERDSITARADADVVLALALVHHLAIGGNVPLVRIADWFAELAPALIVEFVPKNDPQVARLLISREDVFDDYRAEIFRDAFSRRFEAVAVHEIGDSGRTMYAWKRRKS